ncbi:MAG: phosphoheptose isomerase [Acidobacteria bacterium]|nr:MAG: phosphoheptose isomerase [Acidobacteriota bacterium]PYQ81517.1 MAG: phosphoheptose isomerase [Acidobacteriota bacterium]PYQ86598.1 MAG: phosphoheptose isomerase [Acidobacteriota bacterium]PYR09114.1 MAG: phosphoheptose isomerase [Acidobacteriota bacterium]PYR10877.1 MAG: phosphoheptose isomerase [Acidobacteriota bacterium]
MTEIVRRTIAETIALHQRMMDADVKPVIDAAAAIVDAMKGGGKLLVFGNGGSASDAQHLASELVGRFERQRAGFAAIALTTDASVLTSVANDYGYEQVFARQVEALGRAGDVSMGITTSGASPNVLAAFEAARPRGVRTIALTGRDGGAAGRAADIHINVPSDSTARVQEVHRTLLHVICDLVEKSFAG